MWRAIVITVITMACALQAHAQAPSVMCAKYAWQGPNFGCGSVVGICTNWDGVAALPVVASSWLLPNYSIVLQAGAADQVSFHNPFAFDPELRRCPSAFPYVVMASEHYNMILDSANVVTKLQEGYELGVVALACVGILAGFWIGYRAVQRGSSQ